MVDSSFFNEHCIFPVTEAGSGWPGFMLRGWLAISFRSFKLKLWLLINSRFHGRLLWPPVIVDNCQAFAAGASVAGSGAVVPFLAISTIWSAL